MAGQCFRGGGRIGKSPAAARHFMETLERKRRGNERSSGSRVGGGKTAGCSAGGDGVAVSEKEEEVAGWGEGEEKVSGGYRRVSESRSLEGAIGRPRLVAFSQLSHQELVLHSSPHSLSLLHPNPGEWREIRGQNSKEGKTLFPRSRSDQFCKDGGHDGMEVGIWAGIKQDRGEDGVRIPTPSHLIHSFSKLPPSLHPPTVCREDRQTDRHTHTHKLS